MSQGIAEILYGIQFPSDPRQVPRGNLMATTSRLAMTAALGLWAIGQSPRDDDIRTGTLASRIRKEFKGTFGSDEHLQIVGLIDAATKYVVDAEAARSVLRTLDEATWDVESRLDLIPMPTGPIWYEWPLPTKGGWGGGDRALTGCLVVPHPLDDRLLTIVTAWHGAGLPSHAYAVAIVHFDDLVILAAEADSHEARDKAACLTRIMSNVRATIPEGFKDEIAILYEGKSDVNEAALRSATAEVPYLLALMLAANTDGGLVVKGQADDQEVIGFPDLAARSRFARIMDGLRSFAGVKPTKPVVNWLAPLSDASP